MIENGNIEIEENVIDNKITYCFTYDHKKAISGAVDNCPYCRVEIYQPNTYLMSMLDVFESEDYTFTDGSPHPATDIMILSNTNGIIVSYTIKEINIYVRKIYIQDGDRIKITKENGTITNVEVMN